MDQLRVSRVEMGRVEPSNPNSERRRHDDGQPQHEGTDERSPQDELALILRRHGIAGPDLARTRAELIRDEGSGELFVRVTDAETDAPVSVVGLAELTAMAGGADAIRGLFVEKRT